MKLTRTIPVIASVLCICMMGGISVASAGPFSDKNWDAKRKLADAEKKKEAKAAKAAKAAKKKAAKNKSKTSKSCETKSDSSDVEQIAPEQELAQLMEKYGDNPNAKGESGSSLFIEAAKDKKVGLAEKLVEKGADVTHVDEASGQTPLYAAAATGSASLVNLVLEKGADVNAKNANGETALCGAAKADSLEAVKLLVEKGADVNVKNAPPMNYAVVNDNASMVRYFLSKGADRQATDKDGNTAVSLASKLGRAGITGQFMGTIK